MITIRKNIEIILLSVVALVLVILDIAGITSLVSEAILAILVFIAFQLIRLGDRMDEIENRDKLRAITQIYEDSTELPPLEVILSNASTEVIFWGSVMGHIVNQRNLIRKKLSDGVNIKILFMSYYLENNVENPLVNAASKLTSTIDMRSRLSTTYEEFKSFRSTLRPEQAARLEIRTFDTFPTAAYLFVDRDSQYGLVRLTPSLFGFESGMAPSFEFSRHSKTYQNLAQSFELIWINAKPFESGS